MNLIIIVMIVIGGLSKIYKRFLPVSIGFELKTFFTVCIAYSYGIYTGVLAAGMMVIISAIVAHRFCHWILIKIFVYAFCCVLVGMFKSAGIIFAGRLAVIVLNVLYVGFNIYLKDLRAYSDILGNVLNVIFNFLLLGWFGEGLVSLL